MKLDKKQNTASVGLAGCVGLLSLLLVSLVTPFTSGQAHAEGGDEDTNNGEVDDSYGGNAADYDDSTTETNDDGIEPYAATASTVGFSFKAGSSGSCSSVSGGANCSASLTPVDANGAKAKIDVQATVTVQNSGGYSVYIGSTSSQLKNGTNTIDSVSAASTYANLPLNRWGYSARKASSSSDVSVADSYVAMPATVRGTAFDSNTSTSITSETRYYMLSFAANIGADKPAGTYTNAVTMSVVSSPLEISNKFGIENMQQMTSAVCSSVANGTSDQLKDTRDGKYYWVSKLADGKCWMTQNLDLDLSTSKTLTSADTDVTSNYTPNYTTATTATSSTINASDTGQNSWSLGNYRITNPDTSSSCGSGKNSAADCPTQFTAYTTPTSQNGDVNAHYILGNHYQWNAATAGTGGTITSGTATSSICPKGWRLPTSNTGGEFEKLVTALGGTSSTDNVTKAPFYGVRGGYVDQSTSYLFNVAGAYGYYWSSTPVSNGSYAYYLNFGGTTSVYPSNNNYRQYGFSVRCVAR